MENGKFIINEDIETASFEIGVMLFHGLSGKSEDVKKLSKYDIAENVKYLYRALEKVVDEVFVKDGFRTQGVAHNYSEKEIDSLYKVAIETAKEPVKK